MCGLFVGYPTLSWGDYVGGQFRRGSQRVVDRVFSSPNVFVYLCGGGFGTPLQCEQAARDFIAARGFQNGFGMYTHIETIYPKGSIIEISSIQLGQVLLPDVTLLQYDEKQIEMEIKPLIRELSIKYHGAHFTFAASSLGAVVIDNVGPIFDKLGVQHIDAIICNQCSMGIMKERPTISLVPEPKLILILKPDGESTERFYSQPYFAFSGIIIEQEVPVWKYVVSKDGVYYYFLPHDPHGDAVGLAEKHWFGAIVYDILRYERYPKEMERQVRKTLNNYVQMQRPTVDGIRLENPKNLRPII